MRSRSSRLLVLTLALALPVAAAQTQPAQPAQTQPAPATQTQPAPATPALPAPAMRVTLQQALQALQQSPGWRSADLQYRSASQSLDAARARAGLSLTASADVSAVKIPTDGDWTSATTLGVQAGVNVLPWSSAQGSVRLAEHALYRAGLDQKDAQNTLALGIVQGYLNARNALAALQAAQAQATLAARQLQITQAQQQTGTRTAENTLTAQAAQENAQAALAQASSALDTALRQLYNTLGQPAPTLPADAVTGLSLPSAPTVPGAPASLDTLLATAARSRADILRAQSSVQDAREGLDAARFDRAVPNVSATVQYGQIASSTASAGSTVSSSLNFKTGQLNATASVPLRSSDLPTGLALGLSGSYGIIDRSADATVTSANLSLASATLGLSSTTSAADLDVRQKYAALQNALLGLNGPRTSLKAASTALVSAQARLQAGLGTALDVQQAELNVVQAQNTLDQAVSSAYLASLNLSVATGEFTPALIQLPDAALPGLNLTLALSTPTPEATPAAPGGQP
ncbi:TolC family protein [Deinococcus aquiradiocola]|uniref:Transporter n=1 Tax=Deinococcus aquiradiocola TaxID=393059 RepID=A0A917PIN4_9DEIO|nr:TolC family protein [Deinococcus aquiradiocola]GGJ80803.1 hypothetical protein GCM10008939_25890 [Deinococcus aquiradiocola]